MLDAPRRRRAQLDALHGYEQIRDRLSAPLFEVTDRIAAYRWDLPELPNHTPWAALLLQAITNLRALAAPG